METVMITGMFLLVILATFSLVVVGLLAMAKHPDDWE